MTYQDTIPYLFFIALIIMIVAGIWNARRIRFKEREALGDGKADTEKTEVIIGGKKIIMTVGQKMEYDQLTTEQKKEWARNLDKKYHVKKLKNKHYGTAQTS